MDFESILAEGGLFDKLVVNYVSPQYSNVVLDRRRDVIPLERDYPELMERCWEVAKEIPGLLALPTTP